MRTLNVILAIVVSAVIGLAVLEGGLRLIGFGPPKNLLRFDPAAGWSKKADASQHKRGSEFDVTVATNGLGLRDDPMESPAKPAGTFRVLTLGDSFTQGWSVSRDDLFVDILERWWQAEGRKVDVVNAGTEGWSTDQQVAWFLEYGADFEPDLVLIFPYENDLYWCAEDQYLPDSDKPRFTPEGKLEERELVDRAGQRWTDDFALTRKLFEPAIDGERFFFTPAGGSKPVLREFAALLEEQPEFMKDAEQRARGALLALESRCKQVGAAAVLVPIPSHSVVDEDYARAFGERNDTLRGLPRELWSPDRPVDTFLRLAGEAGLTTLDPRPALRAIAKSEPLYFDVDWHLNPAGNAVFARFLKSALEQHLPDSHRAVSVVDDPVSAAAVEPAEGGLPFALKLYLLLWVVLTGLYIAHYRDEPTWQPPLKVAALLASVFGIFIGARFLIALVPPQYGRYLFVGLVGGVLIFVGYKLGRRLGTIAELMKSFTLRGHWYLMPLIVVLLTVGSLLVVAASSPLVAPFIYTLF